MFCDEMMRLVNLYFTEKGSFMEGSLVMGILRRSLLGTSWVAEELVWEILQSYAGQSCSGLTLLLSCKLRKRRPYIQKSLPVPICSDYLWLLAL